MKKFELTNVLTALDKEGKTFVITEYTEFELAVGIRKPMARHYRLALKDIPVKRISKDEFLVGESGNLVRIVRSAS